MFLLIIGSSYAVLNTDIDGVVGINFVKDIYCKLTGCTMEGDLDMGGYNILNAGNISGSVVNVTGGTDTKWTIDGETLINDSGTLKVNKDYGFNDSVQYSELNDLCSDGEILVKVAGEFTCIDLPSVEISDNHLNYTKDFDGVDKVTLSFYIPA